MRTHCGVDRLKTGRIGRESRLFIAIHHHLVRGRGHAHLDLLVGEDSRVERAFHRPLRAQETDIGIQEFANDIEVLPTSQSDERLRQALWSRLYCDPTFSDFASMSIPPVHIIVSRSRVFLTGVVNNQLMKQKAESIIRQTPGVLSVESRLRIGS